MLTLTVPSKPVQTTTLRSGEVCRAELREIRRDIPRCQNLMEVLQMLLLYEEIQDEYHEGIKSDMKFMR